MAMALLLHGGLLGGMGGEAAGVDGYGEGAWTLATPAEGFLAASGTGELAHLLHLCLFRAFSRGASFERWPSDEDASFTTLRAKGGFLVSADLRSGVGTDVTIDTGHKALMPGVTLGRGHVGCAGNGVSECRHWCFFGLWQWGFRV